MGNAWLKMYTSPTGSNGRTVSMPTVSSFKGSDGFTYSFTKRSYWWSNEDYETAGINPYAKAQIKKVTGKDPVINIGSWGQKTNEKGDYWIAVGPNVVNPKHASNVSPTAEEMYAKGRLDVVVKDEAGTLFYIPAVVGDTKNHTWSNGIIQTYKSYPNGAFTSAHANFNGVVCAEFIGPDADVFGGFSAFEIVKIIFYAS